MSALDGIKARLQAATPGSWEVKPFRVGFGGDSEREPDFWEVGENIVYEEEDAELIAHAPTDLARLVAAVEAVEKLHEPLAIYELDDEGHVQEDKHVRDICGTCSDSSVMESLDDGNYDLSGEYGEVGWPCPTANALAAGVQEAST